MAAKAAKVLQPGGIAKAMPGYEPSWRVSNDSRLNASYQGTPSGVP